MNTIVLGERAKRHGMQARDSGAIEDERAIRETVAAWHAATSAGEVSEALELMADDITILAHGKMPMRGRASFEYDLRKLLVTHTVESRVAIQEVEASGDMGYCRSMLYARIAPRLGGRAVVREGHSLSVLRRQDNGLWRIARNANLHSVAAYEEI